MAQPQPVDVALARADGTLTIEWEDGFRTVLPFSYLRAWCPCAACQGHSSEVVFRPVAGDVEVRDLQEVGAYALGITFGDGHDSGIYRWTFLRQIAPETPPKGPKQGRFVLGRYEP